MATFILVHGMFHGGWCWDLVRKPLEAAGHTVLAPDLAGCGGDPTPAGLVTFERWTDDVAALALAAEAPVILVGHSRGGFVVSQVAEQAAEKISALVYLTALMLPNGAGPFDMLAIVGEAATAAPFDVRMSEDGMAMLPPENSGELFLGECSDQVRDWALGLIRLEPIAPLTAKLATSDARYGAILRFYIETLRDRTVPLAVQRALIERGQPVEVISMDCDHSPELSHPTELAAHLDAISGRVG